METLKERYRKAISDIQEAKIDYRENILEHKPADKIGGSELNCNDCAGNYALHGEYFEINDFDIPCYFNIDNGEKEFVDYTNKLKIYVSSYEVGELIVCVFDKYKMIAKHNIDYGNVTVIFDI